MKLTEIKEDIMVECSCCSCGKSLQGFVRGRIYFGDIVELKCDCRYAYHVGSALHFATEICPKCIPHAKEKHWIWDIAVNPCRIKVVKS